MLAKVFSSAVLGIDAYLVDVEVDIAEGLPTLTTVGLPDIAVKESRDRVRSAISNSGFYFPMDRITVNLAPADIKKEGSLFDLPIALGILAAIGVASSHLLGEYAVIGELSLDGTVRPIKGALPIAVAAKESKLTGLILPKCNAAEAAVVKDLRICGVNSLAETVQFLNGEKEIEPLEIDLEEVFKETSHYVDDFSDVKGQEHVKRALEIAVAGNHNVLLIGPPGSGKTMLARRLPTIMPTMNLQEAIETTKIHSISGLISEQMSLIGIRPFRAPHHTISDAGLIGGGHIPKPGEVSLSHNGVLFLDELPEFRRNVLEALRQPLEDATVTISRATLALTYPANFMLVAAMNPCPCGHLTDPKKECRCSPIQIRHYTSKISGPLLDRIDLHIDVPTLQYKDLSSKGDGEPSEKIRQRVNAARTRQLERFKGTNIYSNSQMKTKQLREFCHLAEKTSKILDLAIDKFGLSARAYDRIIKVARTIADLEGVVDIATEHISEAIQYRSLDREQW